MVGKLAREGGEERRTRSGASMRYLWLPLVAHCIIGAGASAEVSHSIPAPISERSAGRNYAWISFMTLGPASEIKGGTDEVASRRLRVVVTLSEIYNSLSIEELTFGEENCCVRVATSRSVSLESFMDAFGMHGEVQGCEFDKWLSPSSFAFTFQERRFILTNAGAADVSVVESN